MQHSYVVRTYVPAALAPLDRFAYLASHLASAHPHIQVLGVHESGGHLVASYLVLALGLTELFAILHAASVTVERVFNIPPGSTSRVTIERRHDPDDPPPSAS